MLNQLAAVNFPLRRPLVLAFLFLCAPLAGASQGAFLGPSPYLSFADSPFNGGSFSYFYLEDFEDGALNATGASSLDPAVVTSPGPLTDSVDGDDGIIDGLGNNGRSYLSGSTSLTFQFSAAALGGFLPTHAGIVWTDVGQVNGGTLGFGAATFSALDGMGNLIGVFGPNALGDGTISGATAEDRFFGVIHAAGISQITISVSNSTDWEADHLQFGRVVPEPSTLVLFASGVGMIGLVRLRRKR